MKYLTLMALASQSIGQSTPAKLFTLTRIK